MPNPNDGLPSSIQTEVTVLGAMLLDAVAITDASAVPDDKLVAVAEVHPHPAFHPSWNPGPDPTSLGRWDDIGLLILDRLVTEQPWVAIAPASCADRLLEPGRELEIAGFGMAADDDWFGSRLNATRVPFEHRLSESRNARPWIRLPS